MIRTLFIQMKKWRICNMAQYFILNTASGELEGEYEDVELANVECDKLNDNLPYYRPKCFRVFDQYTYNAWLGLLETPMDPAFIVYGVGRYSDAYPVKYEIIKADSPSEARQLFEQRHREYRSISADPV